MASADPTKPALPTARVNTVANIFTVFFMFFLSEYETAMNSRSAARLLSRPASRSTYFALNQGFVMTEEVG